MTGIGDSSKRVDRARVLEVAGRVFDLEIDALGQLRGRLNGGFCDAVLLLQETLEKGGKIIVTGVGKSGHVGQKIAATLTSTGAPAVLLDAVNAVHGDLGILTGKDIVIILSYSGETDEIRNILPGIKRVGCPIIALTGHAQSILAKTATVHLDTRVEKEACPLNLAPTASTTAMLCMGDALAMALLDLRGFQKEDFAQYHPGGAIGRNLLLRVDQIMRPREAIPLCKPQDTVAHVLALVTEKRCGAAIVEAEDGTLAGIYTHGDFARSFQRDAAIGGRAVGEVMTKKPVSVQVDKLAVEVLNIFETHSIQDLIVLDAGRKPVGLIDVMDLTRYHLI